MSFVARAVAEPELEGHTTLDTEARRAAVGGALEDALQSYQKAEDLGARSGDANAAVFKANADRVRARLATQALERPARP